MRHTYQPVHASQIQHEVPLDSLKVDERYMVFRGKAYLIPKETRYYGVLKGSLLERFIGQLLYGWKGLREADELERRLTDGE